MENKLNLGKAVKAAALAMFAVLLLLIFLSKTIYGFNLPKVTAQLPFRGRLTKTETAVSTADFAEKEDLYAPVAGRVAAVFFGEGETAKEGEALFEIDFLGADSDIVKQIAQANEDYRKKLDDLYVSREKLNLDLERINANIENQKRKMRELLEEDYASEEVSRAEIVQCENDIKKADEDYNSQKRLFELGAISFNDLDNAKKTLDGLYEKLETLNNARDENIKKAAAQTAEKEKSREKQLADYDYQLESLAQDIKAKNIDIKTNFTSEAAAKKEWSAKIDELNEKLAAYAQRFIYAPFDCKIDKISATKGQNVNQNAHLAQIGASGGFTLECGVSADNNFIVIGDVYNAGNASRTVKATVTKITVTDKNKIIKLNFQDEQTSCGETFTVNFQKQSGETYLLVPNGAVGSDSNGYFLRVVKRRNGILGKEFYTERLSVYLGDADASNTVVTQGVRFTEPVAVISDKTYIDGDTISLTNAGDFFE